MTPTQQYFKDGDYSKLSEHEQNGIVAVLEGKDEPIACPQCHGKGTMSVQTLAAGHRWDEECGWCHGRKNNPAIDYLHSWELCGPLIVKYELPIIYGVSGIVIGDICYGHDGRDREEIFMAAIVHAVCEIAREQQREKAKAEALLEYGIKMELKDMNITAEELKSFKEKENEKSDSSNSSS